MEIGAGGSTGGGGGIPALSVLDTFNRATAGNLNSGAPAGVAWNENLVLGINTIAVLDTTNNNIRHRDRDHDHHRRQRLLERQQRRRSDLRQPAGRRLHDLEHPDVGEQLGR